MEHTDQHFTAQHRWEPFQDEQVFVRCHFEEADLREVQFDQCHFEECSFVKVRWLHASFQDCTFQNCHMQGLDFTLLKSLMLSFTLDDCTVRYANFAGSQLSACAFHGCDLTGCDFSQANLSKTTLSQCNLAECLWEEANLKNAYLAGSQNLVLNPATADLQGAQLELNQLPGLLNYTGIKIV